MLLYKGSDAITSSALLAASACIVTPAAAKPAAVPPAGAAVTVAVAPALAAVAVVIPPAASPPAFGASDAAGVAAAAEQCAQRPGHAHRVGIFQIDDRNIAAGPSRRVELTDQGAHAGD